MILDDNEKAMLDGQQGKACQKAMELLIRYGEALGAERFVDTDNIAGVPGSANKFVKDYYKAYYQEGHEEYDVIFSFFDLDGDEVVEVPRITANSCHLQGGIDPENWETLGATPETLQLSQASEAYAEEHGVKILKTCTPYLAGNVPKQGEHCAWMESSAVVYCNSVLGARTNTEGRESTSSAMLTGKIPDFGFHRDENRFGTHLIKVEVEVSSIMDWGMLGYFTGDKVLEHIPVLTGKYADADLLRHKHFGAAAASSGGVEMYHVVGVTPEADTMEMAFGPRQPVEIFTYGKAERSRTWDNLNANASNPDVDFIMLGCPHYSLEQIRDVVGMLDGKRISANCRLWIFTSRLVRMMADQEGYTKAIQNAGGVLLTDTCSAIGQAIPPGTRVAALDSAKQTHYLPAFMGIEAWFGSTQDCINAALSGRWNGVRP
jgi:hypothetical protein